MRLLKHLLVGRAFSIVDVMAVAFFLSLAEHLDGWQEFLCWVGWMLCYLASPTRSTPEPPLGNDA